MSCLHPAVERDLGRRKRPRSWRLASTPSSRRTVSARRPRPRPRAPRSRARRRRANAASGRGSSSSRLRERSARSSALTRLPCSASTASTSRSRKRRRSDGRTGEQRVHGRHQPDHAQVIGESRRRADRLAVDAAFARTAAPSSPAGARCRCRAWRGRARLRPRPQTAHEPSPSRERDLVERGAAQPAAGRQERDRLDQIGLAGAVGPDQHDRSRVGVERGARDSCGNWCSVRRRTRVALMARLVSSVVVMAWLARPSADPGVAAGRSPARDAPPQTRIGIST